MSDGSDSYRYGFNGKENDFEPKNGQGTQQDYGMRIYDPRLGKFLSVDPLTQEYPWYTPYQFAGNMPIVAIDIDGLEEFVIHEQYLKYCDGRPFLYKINYRYISPTRRSVLEDESALFVSTLGEVNESAGYTSATFNHFRRQIKTNLTSLGNNTIGEEHGNAYNEAKKRRSMTSLNQGHGVIYPSIHRFSFANDGGQTKSEVRAQFLTLDQTSKDNIEKMIAIMKADPTVKVTIEGIASPQPSTNNNTEVLSADVNIGIARRRAQATAEFFKDYALEKYDFAIPDDRIIINSKVRDSNPDPNQNNDSADKSSTIQIQ